MHVLEARLDDTDDRERPMNTANGPPDDVRVCLEGRLPQAMTDESNRRRACALILFTQHPAKRHADSQRGEVRRRHGTRLDLHSRLVEYGATTQICRHVTDGCRMAAQILSLGGRRRIELAIRG